MANEGERRGYMKVPEEFWGLRAGLDTGTMANEGEQRVYMIVSEEFYGRGLRGVFSTLAAARAYAAANNRDEVDYLILSYVIGRPDTEREEDPDAESVASADDTAA